MKIKFRLLMMLILCGVWLSAGYSQTGSWEQLGPSGGKVSVLTQDPKDANVLYTASFGAETRLFKTTNGGVNWKYYSTIKSPITRLYIDANNPSVFLAPASNGIYKSIDKGITWNLIPIIKTKKGEKEIQTYVLSMAVNPRNSNIILACGGIWADTVFQAAVFKSSDGGNNWESKTYTKDYGMFSNIAVNPSDPGIIYINGNGREGQLWLGLKYKSSNGGNTFEKDNTIDAKVTLNSILFDPSDAKKYYAYSYTGFYISGDAGLTWKEIKNSPKSIMNVIFSPETKSMYALAFQGLFKSSDNGATWNEIMKYPTGQYFERMVLDSKTGRMIVTDNDGIKLSSNGGKKWKVINDGLTFSSIPVVKVSPSQPGNVFISAEYSGAFKAKVNNSLNLSPKSVSWTSLPRFYTCTALADLLIMPKDPKVMYALEGGG